MPTLLAINAASAAQYQGPIYAGFWKRVAAYLLDTLLIVIGAVLVGLFFSPYGNFESAFQVSFIILAWLYHATLESGVPQATFGKHAFGITVTDLAGGRISFGRATARYFAQMLSGLTFCIGYAMAGWTKYRQGLHDMVAGCLIVNERALRAGVVSSVSLPTAPAIKGWQIGLIAAAAASPFVIGILAAIAIPQYQAYVERARASDDQRFAQGSDAVAEAYFHGMAAADVVSDFYESRKVLPSSLESLDFKAPTTEYSITMDPQNGMISVSHLIDRWALRFTPSHGTRGLDWDCSAVRLTPAQLGTTCR